MMYDQKFKKIEAARPDGHEIRTVTELPFPPFESEVRKANIFHTEII